MSAKRGELFTIDVDPLFALPGYWANPANPEAVWLGGDYHLMSEAGHWDRGTLMWVLDPSTSPCIDAGAPDSDWATEPTPNGERINQGVYGGTAEASKSPALP